MSAEDYVASKLASGALTRAQIVDLVRAFQLQNSLLVDGKPGPITLGCVEEVLASRRPSAPPASDLPNMALDPDEWIAGIDLDHHQRFKSPATLIADDSAVRFAFVGLTEGTSGRASIDPMYREHLMRLHAASVLLGVYHFGRPSSAKRFGLQFGQPRGEAENFARYYEVAHKLVGKMLPPVLDIEDDLETLTPGELIDWVAAWCEACLELTGRSPIIYTYFSYVHVELKGYGEELTKHPLWIADYRGVPPERPREIPNWPWLFWQYTGAGTVRSIEGHVDRNVFRGTRAQLDQLAA